MKTTIVVVILLTAGLPVFAQSVVVKPAILSLNNGLFYTAIKGTASPAKKNRLSLVDKDNSSGHKHFLELIKAKNTGMQSATRPVTFMDGPVMFPITFSDNSRRAIISHQRYPDTNPSAALTLLGLVGGIVGSAVFPNYIRNTYHNNTAAVEAYLQSTYHQHDQ